MESRFVTRHIMRLFSGTPYSWTFLPLPENAFLSAGPGMSCPTPHVLASGPSGVLLCQHLNSGVQNCHLTSDTPPAAGLPRAGFKPQVCARSWDSLCGSGSCEPCTWHFHRRVTGHTRFSSGFTSETIWAWCFLYWKLIDYWFNYLFNRLFN